MYTDHYLVAFVAYADGTNLTTGQVLGLYAITFAMKTKYQLGLHLREPRMVAMNA